jgi:hypothetical protein
MDTEIARGDMEPEREDSRRDVASVNGGKEVCPQCGRILQPHRCKLKCECGYFMSCSEF